MIRQAAVAGQFYSGTMAGLTEQVQNMLEKNAKKHAAIGAVCPHAGLMYSGQVAGKVYSRMTAPDTYIIIGPNHHGLGGPFSIISDGVFRTPLGDVRVDSILSKLIYEQSPHLEVDPMAQAREHSLEVQLPFIQMSSPDAQIVPLCIRHYQPDGYFHGICQDIGVGIAKALSKTHARITIIASTDFTHYEDAKKARADDMAAINAIEEMDSKKLFQTVEEKHISMCGYACVAIMLEAAKELGAKKATLIDYMNSGDITGDLSQVVGYGGLIID